MEYILNQLINGICQGAIYALMAIGYSTIVGLVGMVTFTYGEIMMIGAYGAFYIFQLCGNHILLGLLVVYDVSMLLYDRLMMAALMIYANRIRPQLRFLKR